jgi:PPM family protein phosphatase
METLRLVSAGMTDRGHERKVNEDTILNKTSVMETGDSFGLYVVCDGLGGHQAGDVASRTAVETVVKALQPILPPRPVTHMSSADINHTLWTAVQRANEEIWYQSEQSEIPSRGMGTTLTMAVIINNMAHIAHVGDSRLYLLRDGKLEQLTQDHTMAAALAEAGQIGEEEIDTHPRQNVLTKALGRQKTVEVELMELPLEQGDRLLLCSDGLWKAFKGREKLQNRLDSEEKTAELCQQLLEEANELDGSDNISLIVVSAYKARPGARQRESQQHRVERLRQPVAA